MYMYMNSQLSVSEYTFACLATSTVLSTATPMVLSTATPRVLSTATQWFFLLAHKCQANDSSFR